ncbi:MAG: porin [Desulfobacterales bacterium]|nr:porin [Desulfobacterales bacterium]
MKKWIKLGISLVAVLTMAVSVQAAEWNFYGSARVETFWEDKDIADTTSLDMALQENARIGAKVTVSDDLKARFEYGTKGGSANIRQLWGEWNFGAGKFLVGQTYTPIYTVYSNSAYDDGGALEGYGATSASRKAMLRLSFGGLQIAAVEPGTDALTGTATEVTMPKMELAYTAKFDAVDVKLAGGYQSYEIDSAYDINSYVLSIGAKAKFGAAYLAGSFFTGQNLEPYGFKFASDVDPALTGTSGVDDSEEFGYHLVAGYKLNDMLTLEAGYGYLEAELDQSGSREDDASQYYLQGKITLAPGVYVVPEIGVVDEGKDSSGTEEEETTYFGAKWQINF